MGIVQKLLRTICDWKQVNTRLCEWFVKCCQSKVNLGVKIIQNNFWMQHIIIRMDRKMEHQNYVWFVKMLQRYVRFARNIPIFAGLFWFQFSWLRPKKKKASYWIGTFLLKFDIFQEVLHLWKELQAHKRISSDFPSLKYFHTFKILISLVKV